MQRKIIFLLLTLSLLFFSCNDLTQISSTENFINSSQNPQSTENSSDEQATGTSSENVGAEQKTCGSTEEPTADQKTDGSTEDVDGEQKTDSPTEESSTEPETPPENPNQNIEKLADGSFRIFAPGISQNKFYDANKTGGDDQLCWAATSSNLIAWYQDLYMAGGKTLDSALPRTENQIFEKFKSLMANKDGTFVNGILWYIAGSASLSGNGGFLLNYIPKVKWNLLQPSAYKQVENISTLKEFSSELILALKTGAIACGITDRNFKKGVSGHAITIWGAEYSEIQENGGTRTKLVNSIWISDSDDYKTQLVKCSLSQSRDNSASLDFVKIDYKVHPPFDKIKNIMILYAP